MNRNNYAKKIKQGFIAFLGIVVVLDLSYTLYLGAIAYRNLDMEKVRHSLIFLR